MDGAVICSVPAGLYSSSLTARLAHLCDTVIGLEAVRDDSDIVRVIPEPARYVNNLPFLALQCATSVCSSHMDLVAMVMHCSPEVLFALSLLMQHCCLVMLQSCHANGIIVCSFGQGK